MDAKSAVDLVQAAIREVTAATGGKQGDAAQLVQSVQGAVVARVQATAPAHVRDTAEAFLTTAGMTFLAWGFWILQCKSIEHYGRPDEQWRAYFRDHVIGVLDGLLLDARNMARLHKAAERDAGKQGIQVPRPFENWHEDPAGLLGYPTMTE